MRVHRSGKLRFCCYRPGRLKSGFCIFSALPYILFLRASAVTGSPAAFCASYLTLIMLRQPNFQVRTMTEIVTSVFFAFENVSIVHEKSPAIQGLAESKGK